MDPAVFGERSPGRLVAISEVPGRTHAFIPDQLPPKWKIADPLWPLVVEARVSIAALDAMGRHLANALLLLNPLQYREAQLSNELEGTFVQPHQLMLFEMDATITAAGDVELNALREVQSYKRALEYHRENRAQLPLSLRLIRELHGVLMSGAGVRGAGKGAGAFRRQQVEIGRPARFIPPPANYLPDLLANVEQYIHKRGTQDPLVDAFVVHYQFEAIHPFRDGNGRAGRVLLAIMIAERCGLEHSWLYMSAYFNAHRDEYLDRLFRVSSEGDWNGWIRFCLEGAITQAQDTVRRCERLINLLNDFKERIARLGGAYRLHSLVEGLFAVPVVTIPHVSETYGVSYPTAKTDVERLTEAGILREVAARHPRTFVASEILDITYGRG